MLRRVRQSLNDSCGLPVALLLLAALAARLAWLAYTRHTSEDAFITFRFARQLSQGLGFTYNAGEPIYGTTTPLLTLMLALWNLVPRADIESGAHALGLLASVGSLVLLDAVLRAERFGAPSRLVVLGVLAFSSKVIVLDMQGMEMPLVICLMMASWLAFRRGRPVLAGVLAGALLWTRIDLALWPAVLVVMEYRRDRPGGAALGLAALLTYLPWAAFAYAYFGSPLPFTITAKQVAHSLSAISIPGELDTVLGYLSPLDYPLDQKIVFLLAGAATSGLALWQAARSRRSPALLALSVFAGAEAVALVITRATFQARYLYPLLWSVLVLAGTGVASVWPTGSRRSHGVAWAVGVLAVSGLIVQAAYVAQRTRAVQVYRYDGSLRAMGAFLAERGPESASVLLEPLGYVGYYSGLRMIDEVGLVSPQVVELKRRGTPVEEYFDIFRPTYVIQHCDDAARFEALQASSGIRFAEEYSRLATFNPLGGEGHSETRRRYPGLDRSSCYIIWQEAHPGSG